MKASIIKIGNSRGIRIPKPVFVQCGFEEEVELEVLNKELVIRSPRKPREGWEEAFKSMKENCDDTLSFSVAEEMPPWDEDEWEWK